jgi:hypothetical protein
MKKLKCKSETILRYGDNLNKKVISAAGFITLLVFLLATMTASHAGTPSEPHNADAMWVEPATMNLTAVGQTFNVTIWVNITEDVFGWSVGLLYNRTYLKCTVAKYSAGTTSELFAGHITSPAPLIIDTSYLGNGSILAYESLLGTDFLPGPCNGTLMFATFQVMSMPPIGQNVTFDITTSYPSDTWVKDPDLNSLPLTTYNATYKTIPEFPTLLILPVLMGSTILAATISKRKRPVR